MGSFLDLTRSDKAQVIADFLDAYPEGARESVVMVGDREHDMTGACAQRIDAIGGAYSYGSLTERQAARDAWLVRWHGPCGHCFPGACGPNGGFRSDSRASRAYRA